MRNGQKRSTANGPSPDSAIARRRRDEIVTAATEIIASEGLHRLSLARIEKRTGMTRGQLTYYFRAKEAILLAVFDRMLARMIEEAIADAARHGAPPPGTGHAWDGLRHALTARSPPTSSATRQRHELFALIHTFMAQVAPPRRLPAEAGGRQRRLAGPPGEPTSHRRCRPRTRCRRRCWRRSSWPCSRGWAASSPWTPTRSTAARCSRPACGYWLPCSGKPRCPQRPERPMSDPRTPTAARSAEPANGELLNRVQQIRLDDQLGRRPAGGGTSWLPWVLCVLLALAWAGVAIRSYRNAPEQDASAASAPSDGKAASGGSSAAAGSTDGGAIPPVKGYLVPARQIAVSPIDVGGRIVELNFVEGRRYEKGYVLAKIDPSSYQAARDEAAAMLASAEQRQGRRRAALRRPAGQRQPAARLRPRPGDQATGGADQGGRRPAAQGPGRGDPAGATRRVAVRPRVGADADRPVGGHRPAAEAGHRPDAAEEGRPAGEDQGGRGRVGRPPRPT